MTKNKKRQYSDYNKFDGIKLRKYKNAYNMLTFDIFFSWKFI